MAGTTTLMLPSHNAPYSKQGKMIVEPIDISKMSDKQLEDYVKRLARLPGDDQEMFLRNLNWMNMEGDGRTAAIEKLIINSPDLAEALRSTCREMVDKAMREDAPKNAFLYLPKIVVFLGTE